MESLKAAPFNKVRFCVFPKHYDFNHNEPPCFAFEKREDGSWDVDRPCFAFWERLGGGLGHLPAGDAPPDMLDIPFIAALVNHHRLLILPAPPGNLVQHLGLDTAVWRRSPMCGGAWPTSMTCAGPSL